MQTCQKTQNSAGRTSVVVPCYKVDTYLNDALESVRKQTRQVREIIVIDDGSPSPIKQPEQWEGPPLHWIRTENRGLAAARNLGITKSSGEFIAFLDADDFWSSQKIFRQETALSNSPEKVGCYTRCVKADGYYEFGPYPDDNLCRAETARLLWYGQFFPPSSFMVRASIARKVGGFREGLANGEDLDFWFRILQHGGIIGISEGLTWYRLHPAQITTNTVRKVMGSKESRRQIIEKYSDLLLSSGLPENKLWDAYRNEILCEYFRRNLRPARIMLWDYVKDHPSDFAMWKYLLCTCLPPFFFRHLKDKHA